uniref:Uncharacterized protein n=1 Tax=Physcomitrium patens TaxID=3218 RepID=A0A2K1JZU4_PHYPA|nr:hypothetical protein PHYPA_014160 [Physcomitrium patens]
MDVTLPSTFVESLVVSISILRFGNVCAKKPGSMLRPVALDTSLEGSLAKIWDTVTDSSWSFSDSIVLPARIESGAMMKKTMTLASMPVDSAIAEACK